MKYIEENGASSVPIHLRNAPTKLMKNEGYGKNYKYPHSNPSHFINENYMPENLLEIPSFYMPSDQGREKFL